LTGIATMRELAGRYAFLQSALILISNSDGTHAQNSVRHNLSSNRAFKKMERCAGERGKGFFWSVDPDYEHLFEEQNTSSGKTAGTGPAASGKKKEKGGASSLEPPLKRSVKGEAKGGMLPPPLTTAPLHMKGIPSSSTVWPLPMPRNNLSDAAGSSSTGAATSQTSANTRPIIPSAATTLGAQAQSQTGASTPAATKPLPTLPHIPFVVAPLPPSFRSINPPPSTPPLPPGHPNPNESLVLHEGTLYLHPTIFADLTAEHLRALEGLGMQTAIEILKGHIVSYLREMGRMEGRGRGRGRRGGMKRGGAARGASASATGKAKEGGLGEETTGTAEKDKECAPAPVEIGTADRAESPILVVDDDEDEQEADRIAKRRKVDAGGGVEDALMAKTESV
jgi:forkhead box protein K